MPEDTHGKPDRGSASSVLSDPEVVRREYSTEAGLRARASVYEGLAGSDARDIAFEAVREARPRRVLEVGCGWGEFAARMRDELGADVVAIDLSPRMVELARERGVDAMVGDVQDLPFEDGGFDCAVANWMLYHVPEIDRGLDELARVLTTDGSLVAATNGARHWRSYGASLGETSRAKSGISSPRMARSCCSGTSGESSGPTTRVL